MPLTAEKAEKLGLVNHVVQSSELLKKVCEVAEAIMKNNRDLVLRYKVVINDAGKYHLWELGISKSKKYSSTETRKRNCQLKNVGNARNAKEGHFDKLQKEEHMRVEQSYSMVDPKKRDEKLQEIKEFEEEGEKLMKLHEEKKAEMKSRHWKDEIDLEEGFNTELTQFMDKYTLKDKVQG
ncbi:hypothetical protein L2E82_28118 [Cichorium intybus]|uniref:Uncharacterized protein n=1 Tax=Cichorium intybus TaxID=13427 RepID=A0ACB9CV15_CICIN|nr:hypothetical protein L2E82_28118 [Cichorium intybus]